MSNGDRQELVVRPFWWQVLVGIVQVAKFAVLVVLVLIRVQMFVPKDDIDESTKMLVYTFAHDDACSAVPMIFLGLVSIKTASAVVLSTVEWIQIVYFVVFLANLLREWICWGTIDIMSLVAAPILLIAHGWMYWKTRQVASLDHAKVVARADNYEQIEDE